VKTDTLETDLREWDPWECSPGHNFPMAVHRTPGEVAEIIENFLNGTGHAWDWDDFCSLRIDDSALDAVRIRCVAIRDEDPHPTQYCGPVGMRSLSAMVFSLRKA
jgi:hypothetical protein